MLGWSREGPLVFLQYSFTSVIAAVVAAVDLVDRWWEQRLCVATGCWCAWLGHIGLRYLMTDWMFPKGLDRPDIVCAVSSQAPITNRWWLKILIVLLLNVTISITVSLIL